MGQERTQRDAAPSAPAAEARVRALLARHGPALLRVARQVSLCHDDALDAFQRGLEIYVRRLETIDTATEAAWLKVVIRHEALAIRRSRTEGLAEADVDADAALAASQRSVEDQVLSGDRVSRSAEALRGLKPDEARALMLKAHGLSYDEIARHCGWTYTKVNRAITEGRRRFMEVYGSLEAGEECERYAPVLQALAAGTATSEQLVEIRPHLRHCTACRATVRELHRSRPRRAWVLFPVAALRWLRERFAGGASQSGTAGEPMPAATRLQRIQADVEAAGRRVNAPDLAAGIHILASGGGGRLATLGAIAGLCLSGIGAGTACVLTGVVHAPFALWPHRAERTAEAPERHRGPHPRSLAADLGPVRAARRAVALTPAPTPTPTRTPSRRPRRQATPAARSAPSTTSTVRATTTPPPTDPAQGTAPTSQEHAPMSPAPAQPAVQDFAAAPAAGTATQAAAASAPATGGEEFAP